MSPFNLRLRSSFARPPDLLGSFETFVAATQGVKALGSVNPSSSVVSDLDRSIQQLQQKHLALGRAHLLCSCDNFNLIPFVSDVPVRCIEDSSPTCLSGLSPCMQH